MDYLMNGLGNMLLPTEVARELELILKGLRALVQVLVVVLVVWSVVAVAGDLILLVEHFNYAIQRQPNHPLNVDIFEAGLCLS